MLRLVQDNPDPSLFAQEVQNCAGGTVTFGLWSAKVITWADLIRGAKTGQDLMSNRANA